MKGPSLLPAIAALNSNRITLDRIFSSSTFLTASPDVMEPSTTVSKHHKRVSLPSISQRDTAAHSSLATIQTLPPEPVFVPAPNSTPVPPPRPTKAPTPKPSHFKSKRRSLDIPVSAARPLAELHEAQARRFSVSRKPPRAGSRLSKILELEREKAVRSKSVAFKLSR